MCMCPYSRTIYSPLDIYPVMGLQGQMIFLVQDPWGIIILSSTMVEQIFIPTNSVKAFLFLHSPPASIVSFFNNCHSDWHEMVSQCANPHFFTETSKNNQLSYSSIRNTKNSQIFITTKESQIKKGNFNSFVVLYLLLPHPISGSVIVWKMATYILSVGP